MRRVLIRLRLGIGRALRVAGDRLLRGVDIPPSSLPSNDTQDHEVPGEQPTQSGPPPHWLELVRKASPDFLRQLSLDQPPLTPRVISRPRSSAAPVQQPPPNAGRRSDRSAVGDSAAHSVSMTGQPIAPAETRDNQSREAIERSPSRQLAPVADSSSSINPTPIRSRNSGGDRRDGRSEPPPHPAASTTLPRDTAPFAMMKRVSQHAQDDRPTFGHDRARGQQSADNSRVTTPPQQASFRTEQQSASTASVEPSSRLRRDNSTSGFAPPPPASPPVVSTFSTPNVPRAANGSANDDNDLTSPPPPRVAQRQSSTSVSPDRSSSNILNTHIPVQQDSPTPHQHPRPSANQAGRNNPTVTQSVDAGHSPRVESPPRASAYTLRNDLTSATLPPTSAATDPWPSLPPSLLDRDTRSDELTHSQRELEHDKALLHEQTGSAWSE